VACGLLTGSSVTALILTLIVGLAVGLFASMLSGRDAKKKRWIDGLLSSDHRSFETISKQHQRIP
jgi:uncharacterized membrane-anchored protein YhcB (DUF1043 family)